MSINIPAETPDESTNPISVEEFERLHPAMLGAIRKAVREEPARTVIGTVGDDRRSHLSSLALRGIGIEVGRQLSARDMTTEVMGSILERINQAADRLSTEIQELRSELIREHVETVGGGCHGSIHRIESLGEEGKPLAQGSHPLVGIGRFSVLPESVGAAARPQKNCSRYSAAFDIDSSPNCSARTSHMRDDTDFRRGPGGSPNAARHYTRKGGA